MTRTQVRRHVIGYRACQSRTEAFLIGFVFTASLCLALGWLR